MKQHYLVAGTNKKNKNKTKEENVKILKKNSKKQKNKQADTIQIMQAKL